MSGTRLLQLLLWPQLGRVAALLLPAVGGSWVHASVALSADLLVLVGFAG